MSKSGNDIKETIEFLVGAGRNVATIIVLFFTCRAAVKQANAAEKLTEATNQQMQTSESLAAAAREQVEVARRQVTESLRPILIFLVSNEWGKRHRPEQRRRCRP